MNSLTEQQQSEICQLGRIGFSFREVAANFDFDLAEVARQFREEKGEVYQSWYRGYLSAQAEIRKTVLDAALNSSQPAILQMVKYFRQAEDDNLEALEF
jgi:6-phosphogluconate dehydrogenase (decarboxylating)